MSTQATAKAARGYARNGRDELILIDSGLKADRIYLEGRGFETLARINMRPGELLATVGGLRALGDSQRDIIEAARRFHDAGAAVLDIETGWRSDQRGAEMLDRALMRLRGERVMPEGKAAAMQAKSVKARIGDRMPRRQAAMIWKDPRLTIGEAIAQMPGWSARTAYALLGPRGLPVGPRGRKD
jgi:hypothetical protein